MYDEHAARLLRRGGPARDSFSSVFSPRPHSRSAKDVLRTGTPAFTHVLSLRLPSPLRPRPAPFLHAPHYDGGGEPLDAGMRGGGRVLRPYLEQRSVLGVAAKNVLPVMRPAPWVRLRTCDSTAHGTGCGGRGACTRRRVHNKRHDHDALLFSALHACHDEQDPHFHSDSSPSALASWNYDPPRRGRPLPARASCSSVLLLPSCDHEGHDVGTNMSTTTIAVLHSCYTDKHAPTSYLLELGVGWKAGIGGGDGDGDRKSVQREMASGWTDVRPPYTRRSAGGEIKRGTRLALRSPRARLVDEERRTGLHSKAPPRRVLGHANAYAPAPSLLIYEYAEPAAQHRTGLDLDSQAGL
ncbi:hypothetical protein C8R44DRAFT_986935 [Mycena epipterygia]|nr:hypothetical protein C8R44DRAFT_986935 [Mycena epipterygia]